MSLYLGLIPVRLKIFPFPPSDLHCWRQKVRFPIGPFVNVRLKFQILEPTPNVVNYKGKQVCFLLVSILFSKILVTKHLTEAILAKTDELSF